MTIATITTISAKDRAYHRELHMDAEVAWQAARGLRLQLNTEYARAANTGSEYSQRLLSECNEADERAGEFRRREHALVRRLLA